MLASHYLVTRSDNMEVCRDNDQAEAPGSRPALHLPLLLHPIFRDFLSSPRPRPVVLPPFPLPSHPRLLSTAPTFSPGYCLLCIFNVPLSFFPEAAKIHQQIITTALRRISFYYSRSKYSKYNLSIKTPLIVQWLRFEILKSARAWKSALSFAFAYLSVSSSPFK